MSYDAIWKVSSAAYHRILHILVVALVAPNVAVAEHGFTDAEIDSVRVFLHENFADANTCLAIGLLDQSGSRVFGAGKLDNGTD